MAIVVKLEGDVSDLEKKLKEAGISIGSVGDASDIASKKADEMAASLAKIETTTLRTAAGRADAVADAFGNTERVMNGVKDQIGVLEEQFGISLGPMGDYAGAAAQVAGGLEGIIGGGMALVQQFGPMVTGIGPVIASTWAHVTALYAQAAAMIAANLPLILIIAGFALLALGVVALIKYWDEIVEKVPILGTALDAVKAVIKGVADWFTDTLVPAITSIWEKGLKPVIDFVMDNWPIIASLILLPFAPLILLATDAFGIRSALVEAFGKVLEFITETWGTVKETIGSIVTFVTELAPKLLEAAKDLGGALKDGFIAGVKGTVGVIGDLADGLLRAIKSLINTAIDSVNDAIPNSLTISVLGKDIGVDLPDSPIPPLARGTGNFRGGLALVGEEGPELVQLPGGAKVFPAGQTAAMAAGMAAGGGGSGTSGSAPKGAAAGNGAPPQSSGPAPGTEGSGFGYIPDGKGGWQLAKFPLADGQPYWYIDKNGDWHFATMSSEGSSGSAGGKAGAESGATPKAGGPGGVGGSAPVGNRGPAGAGTSAPGGASDYEKQILALAIDTNIRTVQVSDRLGMMVDLAKAQNGILNEIMAVLKAPTKIDFTKDGLVWLRDQLGLATGRQWGTA